MKKILGLSLLAVLLLALPTAPSAAKKDTPKLAICHITHIDYDELGNFELALGHVLIVPSVTSHCSHGDHDPTVGNTKAGSGCGRRTEIARRCFGRSVG